MYWSFLLCQGFRIEDQITEIGTPRKISDSLQSQHIMIYFDYVDVWPKTIEERI